MELLIILIAAVVMGFAGYFIGNTKGRGQLGAIMGLFLGPIGWVIVLLMPAVADPITPEFLAARAAAKARSSSARAKEDAWKKAQQAE